MLENLFHPLPFTNASFIEVEWGQNVDDYVLIACCLHFHKNKRFHFTRIDTLFNNNNVDCNLLIFFSVRMSRCFR